MTTSVTSSNTSYAAEVARLLWPEPFAEPVVARGRRAQAASHRDAYLFPSERGARLLVPTDVPGSSSMLRGLGRGRISFAGPVGGLVERAVSSRAFALAGWPTLRIPVSDPDAESIETHLARCLETEVRVGVLLGTRRVNQKPVLQVFDRDGALVAFAKVGHNELTSALVRREAASLTALGELAPRSFGLPQVLHHGQWSGLEVLLISPLTTVRGRSVPEAARVAAMREVAHLSGTTTAALSESGFWQRLRGDAELLAHRPDGDRLMAAVRTLEERHGADLTSFGGWHGDWGAWNTGMGPTGLQIWDWERYDAEVPIGFDALHFDAQRVRPGDRGDQRQEKTLLSSVPATLSALGVATEAHDLTLRLYLLEIAVRYVEGLTHGATPRLRRRTEWVLSLLERLLAQVDTDATKGRP